MDTLADLKNELRQRLSESTAGTWGVVQYENDPKYDELGEAIFRGQRKICEDALQTNKGVLEGKFTFPIQKGVYQYELKGDFLSVLMLQHFHNEKFVDVRHRNISLFTAGDDPNSTTDGPYQFFDVAGARAALIDEGVCTNASSSATVLNNTNTNLEILGARVGDKVLNLSDKSSANLTRVATTTQLVTDGLTDGKQNRFERNDRYQILNGGENRMELVVWPPLTSADREEVVAQQTILTFTLTINRIVHSIEATLSAAVTNPIRVEIFDVMAGDIYQKTDPESIAAVDESVVGTNEFFFESGILVDTSQMRLDFYDGLGAAVTPTNVTVYAFTGNEFLLGRYARYPRKMTRETESSELPTYTNQAALLWAEYLLYPKLTGSRNRLSQGSKADYTIEVEKVKKTMRIEDRGSSPRVRIALGLRRRHHKNVPHNVTLPLR